MNYFLLSCAATIMINLSNQPWNKEDDANVLVAKSRCGEIYSDAPCLKKFIKKEPNNYNAICGEESK
jgi:hypothetical protein